MNVQLELPADLEAALHPNPERHVLESVLLQMIRRNVISVARAGEILSLNRAEAIIRYTSEGFAYVIELARLGYLETLKRFKVRVLVPPAVLLELKTIKVPS